MNLQEELKALKERIAELEELVKEEQEFPQEGDKYWYINQLGIVLRDEWLGFVSEGYMIEIGNVFKTEQDAHFAAEKLKVEAELRKFSKPFKPWSNNYVVIFTSRGELEMINVAFTNHQGAIHFESREKAQQAVNSIGEERIKKYIFGAED